MTAARPTRPSRRRFTTAAGAVAAAAAGSTLLVEPAGADPAVAPSAVAPSTVASSTPFETRRLPEHPDVTAPDGSQVRILSRLSGGSMAHFTLGPGRTSTCVRHRTVEEIWYFVSGRGEMWREQGGREDVVAVEPGVEITIPLGTAFQFRTVGDQPLAAVAITMPPWPGDGEAIETRGAWQSNL